MVFFHNEFEELPQPDLMQVCEAGHKITGYGRSHPEKLVNRCPDCGARTITACKNCGTDIPGAKYDPEFHSDSSTPPEYCQSCGSAFPWTGRNRETPAVPALDRIDKILNRFHLVCRQLRKRGRNRSSLLMDDEYDVQYLLPALLKIEFDDVLPEEVVPTYAGGSSRMDFLLKDEQIVIEAKKTREGLGANEVGKELLVDIARYKNHQDCKTLICLIYDPDGIIDNPRRLKIDLENESSENLKVSVYIRPLPH